MTQNGQTGIYFHWPFCASKCPYCDFNVHVRDSIDHARWQAAYLTAIEHYAAMLPERRIDSIFFGGGTPSLMPPSMVGEIISAVQRHFRVSNDIEITLEANPTSVELEKFSEFALAGVNRVSLGVQSLRDDDLTFLGRNHDAGQAIKAIETARRVFDRFSFDLIYARPEQSLDNWRKELTQALDLASNHMSLYQLTIERSTPFYFDHAQGKFEMPPENLSADFYHLTQDIMGAAGMAAYETSNHAASEDDRSTHNMIYWRYDDYIGIGPGAHGRLSMAGEKYATRDHHAPEQWLERVEKSGCGAHPFEAISKDSQRLEALMMGLRLNEGMDLSAYGDLDVEAALDMGRVKTSINESWLTHVPRERLSVSQEGMLRLNALIPFIVKAQP